MKERKEKKRKKKKFIRQKRPLKRPDNVDGREKKIEAASFKGSPEEWLSTSIARPRGGMSSPRIPLSTSKKWQEKKAWHPISEKPHRGKSQVRERKLISAWEEERNKLSARRGT